MNSGKERKSNNSIQRKRESEYTLSVCTELFWGIDALLYFRTLWSFKHPSHFVSDKSWLNTELTKSRHHNDQGQGQGQPQGSFQLLCQENTKRSKGSSQPAKRPCPPTHSSASQHCMACREKQKLQNPKSQGGSPWKGNNSHLYTSNPAAVES